jgi:hypothetical protein
MQPILGHTTFKCIKIPVTQLYPLLPTKWEKIQLHIWQRINNQDIQGAQKTKLQKINDPMKKWANELNWAFSKEEVQMAKKHMKKCSISLAIKKMQIKTMLKFHLTLIRMAYHQKHKQWQMLTWMWGKRDPHTLLVECKLVQTLWKTVWRLLKKLKIELSYDLAISLLGIYPKECKSGYNKGNCTTMFIATLFTVAKLWKQPRCPATDEWIKKMWYI